MALRVDAVQLFSPMSQNAMLRSRRRTVARCFDQLTPPQQIEGGLDRAFRQTGCFRKHAQACRHRFPFLARGLSVEIKINEVSGWLPIVADDVAHQNVEDVIIDGNGFAKTRHVFFLRCSNGAMSPFVVCAPTERRGYSADEQLTAIPINGQHFLRADPFGGWTAPFGSK